MKSGFNRTGSQRLQCQTCRRQYTPEPRPLGYNDQTREQAIKLYLEGNGLRRIGRLLWVNHQSLANWVNSVPTQLRAREVSAASPEPVGTLEMDELFTFVGTKKPAAIGTLVEREPRCIGAHTVCEQRTPEVMPSVIDSAPLAQSYFSDAFNTYRDLCWRGQHTSM